MIKTLIIALQIWTVPAQPTVRIGDVDAEEHYMFSNVVSAVRLSDGRIVVANGASNELRVYDARGQHLTTLGRAGGGPGEFQSLRAIWLLPADTMIALDSRNGRLTYYNSGLQLLRSEQISPSPGAVGRLGDGGLLALQGLAPPNKRKLEDFRGLIEFEGLVLLRAAGAATYDTITRGKAGQSYVHPVPPSWRQYPYPFGRQHFIAIGKDRFYYGNTHATEVGIYDRRGKSIGTIKIRGSGRALSSADIQKWIDVDVDKRTSAESKANARNEFKLIPPPRRSPEWAALKLDDAGNLWVRRYGPPWDASPSWDVYSPQGRALAQAKLPARFEPMHIGRDFVLGVGRDELDVEHIEVYPLRRGR